MRLGHDSAAASPRAAEAFLAVRPDLAGLDLRFDVMLVGRRRLPRHLPSAWRIDD